MDKYQWFEAGYGFQGFKFGVVTPEDLLKYDRYKTFRTFLAETSNRALAIKLTSEACRCSQSSMSRAITFFEDDVSKV